MSKKPGRAAPMAPDERRRAIVEAVIPLLVRHGAGVTTRQIAEAAGVAEGTIFRVFPDKCALMRAAAQATMDPASGQAALADIDGSLDLHDTVREMAGHLLERMEQVMAVMIAVRAAPVPEGRAQPHRQPGGPPAFVTEANRAMLEGLTEVFERHRDELTVEPDRAAVVLRSLVFGHLGMHQVETLSAEEIATVLVSGITRQGEQR